MYEKQSYTKLIKLKASSINSSSNCNTHSLKQNISNLGDFLSLTKEILIKYRVTVQVCSNVKLKSK